MPPTSLFGPMLARARAKGSPGTKGKSGHFANSNSGRSGVQGVSASNAASSDFQFTDTLTATNVKSYVLNSTNDIIRIFWNLSVTATGNSTTADIMGAIQFVRILGPGGVLIQMSPMPDFYLFQQRFSPLHQLPSVVTTAAATAATNSYTLYGINLPAIPVGQGVYTLEITIQAAATFNTSCTALSVISSVTLGFGDCGGMTTHFSYSGLPFTPASSGVNDLGPVASIQGKNLVELFLTGLTQTSTQTPDINYLVAQSAGGNVGYRITGQELYAVANAEMVSGLFSAAETASAGSIGYTPTLFPLYALKTTLTLGNGSHFSLNWTSGTPSAAIVARYYWLE